MNYTGLFPSRDADVAGIAFNGLRASDDYLDNNADAVRTENVLEVTYRVVITPYLALQPSFQYVRDPVNAPSQDDAVVAVTRAVVTF